MYFFDARIGGRPEGLAMVSLCEDPNSDILENSKNVLWVTRYQTGQNMYVVPVNNITSVVSLLPFLKMFGYSFLFEDLGQDVAYLDTELLVLGDEA